eukprot:TRINITY_DN59486_c0_g1_i1.p1 TRINITY_DN59486_c0_g1~~TRINITY_DN59486_c0_g1_i1.p1  ORF type:complete len:532 (-),score=303.51 TRINITY_DN59486_c0_g1_i1:68-1663(-)
MVKVKVLSRNEADFTRERKSDVVKVYRNVDPSVHPFEKGREYVRALNAVKLDRVFAKPLVGAMDGHRDSVYAAAVLRSSLIHYASGACDGELRMWNLAARKTLWNVKAHDGFVKGVCSDAIGQHVATCGTDKTIKFWRAFPYSNDEYEDWADETIDELEDEHVQAQSKSTTNAHMRKSHLSNVSSKLRIKLQQKQMMRRLSQGNSASSSSSSSSSSSDNNDSNDGGGDPPIEPLVTWLGDSPFTSVDANMDTSNPLVVSGGAQVDLWDLMRSEPVHSFAWGADSINCVRFNPVEKQLLGSTASDRSIVFYDTRMRTPVRKLIMHMAANEMCWNPMEAFHFSVGSEDHNAYTFDMRKLKSALNVHMDHVAAVMSVDYSPTGKELVTGSYDRTVRIFDVQQGRSREVYHTKRMQRVFSVRFSLDNQFIMSGSDDANVRLWKSVAWRKLGVITDRERRNFNYKAKLQKRFAYVPEVKRIKTFRRQPRDVLSAKRTKHIIRTSRKEKERRRRLHSKPGAVPHVAERRKKIVKEQS